MDRRVLMVFLSLWSSGLWTEDTHSSRVPDDVRLVGGASSCSGQLEWRVQGEWKAVKKPDPRLMKPRRPLFMPPEILVMNGSETEDSPIVADPYEMPEEEEEEYEWHFTAVADVCRRLNCGSVVSLQTTQGFSGDSIDDYFHFMRSNPELSLSKVEINCSDSVRLVNGTGLCSGRLEVRPYRSDQSHQSWSSVCEDDFDQQDAEVVCRQLGCGAPSVLQGALYGEVEAPVWTKEFQCGGQESALLDCRSSDRNSCSSGKAAGLTCSEPGDVRLVGGVSRCDGTLEMKHQDEWKPVGQSGWFSSPTVDENLGVAGTVCAELDCGSAVSATRRWDTAREIWGVRFDCTASSLKKCFRELLHSFNILKITCSDSQTVRLVNGTGLCSGRLEVRPYRSDQSHQSWSSVCEDDFDQQDAEVVCRQLGCGAPSVLQGALYGEVEAPVWTKEFQCGGQESALLDCRSSDRNSCSSGKAAGLTCSDPEYIRLEGYASRCAGELQMNIQGEWRQVILSGGSNWDQEFESAVCRELGCGSAVPVLMMINYGRYSSRMAWLINSSCVQSESSLKDCVITGDSYSADSLDPIFCSDLLVQPNISASSSTDGVYQAKQQEFWVLMGSSFTLSCSIEPQYEGGFFQLVFTTSKTAHNSTLPAVNDSAHFLFSAADHTHRGEYRCVYHVHVFGHNFSSESEPLHLILSASVTELIVRLVIHLLGMTVLITALCCTSKASRNLKNTEIKD